MLLARAARALPRLWPDRNPLRRTLGRVEAAVGAVLAVALLAGAPLAAIAAGHFSSSIGSRAAYSQQAAWHQVPAMLLASVPASGLNQNQVPARWVAPDGRRRTGHIPVPLGAKTGATVMVWVDVAGRLTGPPLQPRRVRDQVEFAPILAFITVCVIVLCVGHLAFGALDRRRLAAWEADWRAIEPKWTGRR
jgi:hypothetical protein